MFAKQTRQLLATCSPWEKALVRDLLFELLTEVHFVTVTTSGHVDNVRVANYASLPASNIGASTPTGKINFVDWCAYGNDI